MPSESKAQNSSTIPSSSPEGQWGMASGHMGRASDRAGFKSAIHYCVALGKLLNFSESQYNFYKVGVIMYLPHVRITLGNVSGWHVVSAIRN